MTTEKPRMDRSSSPGLKESRRCSVCGKQLKTPQKALSMDGKGFCEACYRDCFFDDMDSNHHRALDRCAT